jgi:hypothetical protein
MSKNARIKECTLKHEKKYQDIKDYYFEITSTNLDIIKFLKEDLNVSKIEESSSAKDHRKHFNDNKNVTLPLKKAKKDKEDLQKK